ncbi:MAG: sulfatase family protein, partial [Armatimonadota bacterium]
HHVGRMLDALDELGIADRTLVIFSSDHGEMLGDHGLTQKFVPYQESIRVPLILRLPGKIPSGVVVSHPVNTLDIFATIFDYLELPCPDQEGMSLRPLIESGANNYPDFTFTEMVNYTCFVSNEWKYVWYRSGWFGEADTVDVLYNLQDDPHEMTNLLGLNPDRARWINKAKEIRSEMLAWMEGIKHPHRERLAQSEVR